MIRYARWPTLALAALLGACTDKSPNTSLVTFSKFQSASVVIGQPDFVHNEVRKPPAADTINAPFGRALISDGELYLPDSTNHRLLVYGSVPTTNGVAANLVFGQTDFQTAEYGSTAAQFRSPQAALANSGKLLVADTDNSRIAIFDSSSATSGAVAEAVIGWDDSSKPSSGCAQNRLSYPASIFAVNGYFLVADSSNNRVLIWKGLPTKNGPADVVLGQIDLYHCAPNAGKSMADSSTLNHPTDVWSDGTRVMVVDSSNGRILIWNSFPTVNGEAAKTVLGQADFTSTTVGCSQTRLSSPLSVSSNGTQLFVADYNNNRVLGWNSFPTENGAPADLVLGQDDFSHCESNDDAQNRIRNPLPTARTLSAPAGVALWGTQLFVTDNGNNRHLIFYSK